MRNKGRSPAALMLALITATGASWAAQPESATPDPQVLTEGFLAAHPDVKHRMRGVEALDQQQPEAAFNEFRRAARFADKVSQAMLGEMYWQGLGVEADRGLAYAWMDLAAERGYITFVVKREKYWAELSEDERQRALDQGQAIYAEYGDEVAKPRMQRLLDRGRRNLTGSRVGFVGALKIMIPGPAGAWISIDGSKYYADKYWRPKDYFEWQDRVWDKPPVGTVSIGDIASSPEAEAGKKAEEAPPQR